MAVTQIVGPRIAPLWADPVEWTSTRAYEPFTFVTYQGDSYCSRKDTPIGIQISNNDYWVKVSDYNAQALALQRNVASTIEANETAMQNLLAEGRQTIEAGKNHVDDVANNLQRSTEQIEANKTAISDAANKIEANKTAISDAANKIEANKTAISDAANKIAEIYPLDSVPVDGSTKGITSGGAYTAMQHIEDSVSYINNIRSDSYNPNIKPYRYCQLNTPWTANNEYMQGCTLYNDTLYVAAAPISGNGKGSIYRFPNFSNPVDGILKSDARIELNNCSHPNCLTTYNNLIFAVDGTRNKHITAVDINTFTETAGIDIGWGSITDICISELNTIGNYASLAIFGSLIDANRVLCIYCVYDKSTNVASYFSYKTAPQFQHNSLRQGAAMYSNTRFLVCSFKTWQSDYLYANSSYLLAGNPVEGAPYSMIPIPWEPCHEVEDCFIDSKGVLYFSCNNKDIYILGQSIWFANQSIEPSMDKNRGSSTSEFVPSTNVLLESGEIVGSKMLLGFKTDSKLANNATYSASLKITFAQHNPVIIPICINNLYVTGSAYFHTQDGWCYAFIKGLITNAVIEHVPINIDAINVVEFDLQIGDTFYSKLSSLPSDWKVTEALFEFSLSN